MDLLHLASNCALLGYSISAVLFLLSFQKTDTSRLLGKLAIFAFVIGTIAVSGALGLYTSDKGLTGVGGYLLTAVVGWLSVLGHLKWRLRLMGALVAPLSTLILMIQVFVAPLGAATQADSASTLLSTGHVAMSVLGMGFAIIACALSIFYLWQQTLLKKKLLDQIPESFPAIDKMDRMLTISLWLGFIFITFGLLSGALYTQMYVPRNRGGLEFKVVWAIVVWLWYLSTLLAKNVFSRPGKRIAQMSLGGFALLAVSMFGMIFFRSFGGGE